ncbi:MAG: ribonuclease [Notoacmeibacter sp.]|nr:ribonuclease [Notoacmeibacter sp.]
MRRAGSCASAILRSIFTGVAVLFVLALCACDDTATGRAAETGAQPAKSEAPRNDPLPTGSGFDFYVLSLSWSPSYCAAEGAGADREQCSAGGPAGFIVHGLWPQFEKGYPANCASGEPARVPRQLASAMLDIMPSAGLVGYQWRKHGTCAGLSQEDYLATVRAAWNRVRIPPGIGGGTANPHTAEQAFLKANRGLPADGIAVTCDHRYLREVRICMTGDLEFRSCPAIDRQACRLNQVQVPAR